jgi:recombination protein RecT
VSELAKKGESLSIVEFFESKKDAIQKALPKHMNADRMLKVLFGALRRNPALAECTRESLLDAIMQCSELGLEPDGFRGHAYLVPFKNTKKGVKEVQFIPGYKGLVDLARRSGKVIDIYAIPVYENEPFEIKQGLNRDLLHEPLPPQDRGENLKGCYCVAKMDDETISWTWMWIGEIHAIRSRSKAKDFGPWKTDYEAMCLKTVVRRHMRLMPLSPEVDKAVHIDEMNEVEEIDITPDIPAGKPEVKMPEPLPTVDEEQQKVLDENKHSEIMTLCIDMGYNGKQNSDVEKMIKEKGLQQTYQHVKGEWDKWSLKQEGTSKASTKGSSTGYQFASLLYQRCFPYSLIFQKLVTTLWKERRSLAQLGIT